MAKNIVNHIIVAVGLIAPAVLEEHAPGAKTTEHTAIMFVNSVLEKNPWLGKRKTIATFAATKKTKQTACALEYII